jgi:DNA-binding NtrC family response regulator
MRVLIVDDEAAITGSLKRALQIRGHEVAVIEDPLQVPGFLGGRAGEPLDLILVDYIMPGQTGLDVLRQVREQDRNVSVVLMTAYADKKLAARAEALGCDGFLEKPFEFAQLEVIMREAEERAARRRGGAAER